MNKKPVTRFEFKLNEAIDADIIEFLANDSRTNIGIFREAVRLLMATEINGRTPVDEPAIIDVIKTTISQEMRDAIHLVLSEYELKKTDKTEKTRQALGIKAKPL